MFNPVSDRLAEYTTDGADGAPEESDWRRRWRIARRVFSWTVLALSLIIGAATIIKAGRIMIAHHTGRVIEVDSQGYFLMAKAFGQGKWPTWPDDIGRFRGHVWVDAADGQVAAKYPPGAPLLIAIGYRLNGYDGAMWANTVMAIIGLVAFFLLAWDLFNPALAAICTFIWAFSPSFMFDSEYPFGHSAELCVLSIAMLMIVRWGKTGYVVFAIFAGLFVGFLPLIRPTSLMLWPAAAVGFFAMGGWARARLWREPIDPERPRWQNIARVLWRHRDWIAFVLALAIPVGFGAYFNTTTYGRPWWTGYHLSAEDSAFDWTEARSRVTTLLHIRGYMLEDSFWLLIVIGVFVRAGRTGLGWMLALWTLPMVLLYLGYYFFPPSTAFTRFLLPSLMAAVLCIGLPFRGALLKSPAFSFVLLVAFFTWMGYEPPRMLTIDDPPSTQPVKRRRDDETAAVIRSFRDQVTPPLVLEKHFDLDHGTALYSDVEKVVWDASIYPKVDAYHLNAWTDNHYFGEVRPNHNDGAMGGLLYDKVRHERLHKLYQSLGRPGLRAAFLEHVRGRLYEGKLVLIEAPSNHPLVQQITQNPSLKIEMVDAGLNLWKVTRK